MRRRVEACCTKRFFSNVNLRRAGPRTPSSCALFLMTGVVFPLSLAPLGWRSDCLASIRVLDDLDMADHCEANWEPYSPTLRDIVTGRHSGLVPLMCKFSQGAPTFRRMTIDEELQYEAAADVRTHGDFSRPFLNALAAAVAGVGLVYAADIIVTGGIYASALQQLLVLQPNH